MGTDPIKDNDERVGMHIRKYLSERLLQEYEGQLEMLRSHVRGLAGDQAIEWLRRAMCDLFEESYGLPAAAAAALARLAVEMPFPSEVYSQVLGLTERHALQRALVSVGLAPQLRTYFMAAARGAIEGFALEPDTVVWKDPSRSIANIPSLPPLHSQDSSPDAPTVGRSIFTEGLG